MQSLRYEGGMPSVISSLLLPQVAEREPRFERVSAKLLCLSREKVRMYCLVSPQRSHAKAIYANI
jgi:hypothetical protein